ncbi:MAG TPA: hypothetical protein VHC90_26255, partial [Bryobacteraceae bacterium]|nr:hypothetical protein [Bryobacteraceae bacterium]
MKTVRYTALLAMPLLAITVLAPTMAFAQASAYTSVQGSITKVDTAAKVISVKTATGDTTVKYIDQTKLLELPPGEADVKKATPIKVEDISAGDHILARVQTKDPTGLPAGTIYINRASDIAKENAAKEKEWQTQATSGYAESIDAAGKKATMKVKGAAGAPDHDVTLDLTGPVSYQRFSDSSLDYVRADLAALKPGDHFRVLGTKNADGSGIKVTDLAADNIRQIGATVKSVDAATGTITATDTSKKPVTITVHSATKVKQLDEQTAMMIARIVNPSYQGGGRRGGGGGGRGPAGEGGPGAGPGGPGGGAGFGGRGGGRGRGGSNQIQNLIDTQPDMKVADLKPGEAIIVSGPATGDTFS